MRECMTVDVHLKNGLLVGSWVGIDEMRLMVLLCEDWRRWWCWFDKGCGFGWMVVVGGRH